MAPIPHHILAKIKNARRQKKKDQPVDAKAKKNKYDKCLGNDLPFQADVPEELLKIFKEIGTPDKANFKPDPFQLEALDKVEYGDVLVSAPTGSGKTWIAEQAISRILQEKQRAWYASPLKALSNSIYAHFCELFGPEQVGIVTGDRKENPVAPVIVGTTEILRNQLYDVMYQGTNLGADLVILDEAHFLGDQDRGVVWEEVMIYLPSRVKLLLLSATIENATEIASWLQHIRGTTCQTVLDKDRPVPLHAIYLFPHGEVTSLRKGDDLAPKILEQWSNKRQRWSGGLKRIPPYPKIISLLREFTLLPAIFFLKSRKECNEAVKSCQRVDQRLCRSTAKTFFDRIRGLTEQYPYLAENPQYKQLMKTRTGAHHGGQLPLWKLFIETLMKEGLLEAIFSTSTVAAGVNFPARTVVLMQSDRFNGHEFVNLSATDLHQMTGRAGRRGMDKIGFALLVGNPFLDPIYLEVLLQSPSEPLTSQIKINFSMVLNLLLSMTPAEIKDLFVLSFSTFQRRDSFEEDKRRLQNLTAALSALLEGGNCGSAEEVLIRMAERERLAEDAAELAGQLSRIETHHPAIRFITAGQVVETKGRRKYCILEDYHAPVQGELIFKAVRLYSEEDKDVPARRRATRVKGPMISVIYDLTLPLPKSPGAKDVDRLLEGQSLKHLGALAARGWSPEEALKARNGLTQKQAELEKHQCHECALIDQCLLGQDKAIRRTIARISYYRRQFDLKENFLWHSFLRHLNFLKAEGFVDDEDNLTFDGVWACRLRLDQPLLIAELIRRNTLPQKNPALLAGLIAPFVGDRGPEMAVPLGKGFREDLLVPAFTRMVSSIQPLHQRMKEAGFPGPAIQYWPAATMYAWASNTSWEDTLALAGIDEGDLAMLIFRTADNLRQVASLRDTHPALAATAAEAVDLIMREPVVD
ncbi:MAG: DEAD/DEAH box helicase [Deltaproteobacteria bacterium]|nr:DEAD/DEAH box helicase [Deltaproteobacteria bacterium]